MVFFEGDEAQLVSFVISISPVFTIRIMIERL